MDTKKHESSYLIVKLSLTGRCVKNVEISLKNFDKCRFVDYE